MFADVYARRCPRPLGYFLFTRKLLNLQDEQVCGGCTVSRSSAHNGAREEPAGFRVTVSESARQRMSVILITCDSRAQDVSTLLRSRRRLRHNMQYTDNMWTRINI